MALDLSEQVNEYITPRGELDLFSFAGPERRLRDVSEAFALLLGLTAAEINGRSLLDFVHSDDVAELSEGLTELKRGAAEGRFECRFVQQDAHGIYLRWVVRPLDVESWRAAGTDTAELVKLLGERRDLLMRLDLAIGQAVAATWDLRVVEDRLNWEPQAAEILAVSPEGIPSSVAALAAAVHPSDSVVVADAFAQLLEIGATEAGVRIGADAELRHLSLRGRIVDRDADGQPLRAVGLLLDVSTEKAMEEQLIRMSVSDALTGTPNRRAFDQALRGEWRRCKRARHALSLIMVDIDCFKQFNDRFGHIVGDEALIAVARGLTSTVKREGDLVARYGGEEFAVVLPGTDLAAALSIGQQLVQAARAITVRQAPGWDLSVSVGTATWHPDRETIKSNELLGRADKALYAAKRAGKDQAVSYDASLATPDAPQ